VPPGLLGNAFKAQGSQGFADATIALARDASLTVRQIIDRGGGAHRILAGGPEQIADMMEAWFRGGAADGFNVMFDVFPTGLRDFVDHV
ncbi:nitrilotriacetate monooxygenase, partial [Acinetobacter baumannii]